MAERSIIDETSNPPGGTVALRQIVASITSIKRRGASTFFVVRLLLIVSCILLNVLCNGCARWAPEAIKWSNAAASSSNENRFKVRMSPDAVVIETVLVRFPKTETEQFEDIWKHVNESILDIALRNRLDQNGIRVGLITGEIPPAVRGRLAQAVEHEETDFEEMSGLATEVDTKAHRFQCRAGKHKELIVRRVSDRPITVVTTFDNFVSGETYISPTMLYQLLPVPQSNGQVTLHLQPQIQHGIARQSFVSNDFGVRTQLKRSVAEWEQLAMELKLRRGEVLAISTTVPTKSIGQAFFAIPDASGQDERVVLLIRLAETKLDDLFEPELVEQARTLMHH